MCYVVAWQKCWRGNVDFEQIIWCCPQRDQAIRAAKFLSCVFPDRVTSVQDSPEHTGFAWREAKDDNERMALELAQAALIRRLESQHPLCDDDALKLSRFVLDNCARLGVELPQREHVAAIKPPAPLSAHGVRRESSFMRETIRELRQDVRTVAVNTACLPEVLHTANKLADQAADRPAPAPPTTNATTYTVAALRDMTGLGNNALNRYAKTANVATPQRGERDFKYTRADVRAILQTIIASTAEDKLRGRCKSALQNLPEIAE